MKTLLSILAFSAAITQSLLAQTTTVTIPITGSGPVRQQSIPVLAGEVFELLTWVTSGPTSAAFEVDAIQIPLFVNTYGLAYNPPFLSQSIVIAGPKTVSFAVANNSSLVCTYKLSTASTVATANVASQAVVIPADATAPVDIIFESNTDLITWTAAVAGSYPPSTSKRFFRVRAVAH